MNVTILGSGTILGHTGRNCSGYLVDRQILLDCGPGIWRALNTWNGGSGTVLQILFSHLHVDHTADLISILWERYVSTPANSAPIILWGPEGFIKWFNALSEMNQWWIGDVSHEVHEYPMENFSIGSYTVQTKRIFHSDSSVCIRLSDHAGKSLFYSGDTGLDKMLIRIAEEADLAIIEAAVPVHSSVKDHLDVLQAAQIARKAQVGMLLLTHIYPEAFVSELIEIAKKEFSGRIDTAKDGMIVVI